MANPCNFFPAIKPKVLTGIRRGYKVFLGVVRPGKKTNFRALYLLFLAAALAITVVFLVNVLTIGTSSFGEWGDFFGGVLNPILTFLTFMGLLITIVIQQTELRESRSELKRSADALAEQAKNLNKQSFESTFFKMLDTHSGIVESIDLSNSKNNNTTKGRDCFTIFYRRLEEKYHTRASLDKKDPQFIILKRTYAEFWLEHQHELGHYFRFLYNFVRFIKESDYEKSLYIRLLRAQLSDQELLLIFYNCIASKHGERFKPLVEEFAMLDNMPTLRILSSEHLALIDKAAFGDQKIKGADSFSVQFIETE
ncbi:putative phage abortive infection protein [Stutzerimonas frequens]|uniref:putative phage abortive infection protein n=1 Tax=Stutzerimonas frequens TaxID=2968969 RepID=UPI0012E0D95C|nr:putative phage abortive infection protein [Stutzerimonas frequens]MUT69976.1 hypothetical protein [Stutzerimonas frequens]